MNDKEEKLARKILEGQSLDNAELELLSKSPDCLQYKEVLAHAMSAKNDIEPKASVDRAILQYAASAKTVPQRTGTTSPMPIQLKVVMALAAAIAVLLVALIFVSSRQTKPANSGATESLVILKELPREPRKVKKGPEPYKSIPIGPVRQNSIAKQETPPKTINTHDWDFGELDNTLAAIETELYLDETLTAGSELVESTVL